MHIKKLEISGFKSFVDRTVIHFDHDVIGVVGPNGCGKSNVVDAIRWVMGEQSAKALRGRAMADVIFNGSESRAPHGFAEVTLTFDNSDPAGAQSLPLEYRDYSEIAVTRRIFRDGESEYLINKTPVRLRDMTDLFLGTGVGRKAYSIVEQGKIGLIVSARPEDRRQLIEEAAGITKYRSRRKQAEQKMELTRQNLLRVNDIVVEIDRQLGSLRRQAQKAQRYLRYREELDDLTLWDASHKLLDFVVRTAFGESACANAAEVARATRIAVDTREAQIEVLRARAHEVERVAEARQSDSFHADNEVRDVEVRLDRAGDRARHLAARLEAARAEQHDLGERLAVLVAEERELEAGRDAVAAEHGQQADAMQQCEARLAETRHVADHAAATLAELRKAQAQTAARIAGNEAKLAASERRRSELGARRERLAGEETQLAADLAGIAGRYEEASFMASDLSDRKDALVAERDAARTELAARKGDLELGERALAAAQNELNKLQNRRGALEELERRAESLGKGPKELLRRGDASVLGLAANGLEAAPELGTALAGALGERVECVLVSDVEHGLALLEELRAGNRGRATVLAATARERPVAPVPADGLRALVTTAPGDGYVARALLGDAVLVGDVAEARAYWEQGAPCDLVTPDGMVFHSDGRITGGAGDARAEGMLERRREIRELGVAIDEKAAAITARADELEGERAALARLGATLEEAGRRLHAADIELVTAEQGRRRLEAEQAATERRQAAVVRELAELTRQVDEAVAEHEAAEGSLAAARTESAAREQALAEAEPAATDAATELGLAQGLLTERRVRLAEARERLTSTDAAITRLGASLRELEGRIAALDAERDLAARELGEVAAAIMGAREELVEARLVARRAHGAFEEARVELDGARSELGLAEAELREHRAELDAANEELRAHELELERLRLGRNHLEEGVRERFRGLELAANVGDFHARPELDDTQRRRIRELAELIERMGPVNLDAVKEADEAAERHRFYSEQHADLTAALDNLERAIAQMNRECKRLFRHAFDGINERFQVVFPRMFRGGKAELRLTKPEDLLETGIEILAQPPGKKLGNIELMSGGEKAFTAVSLLFAIFQFKPSPFCILDEVDAPLDEANVGRYIESIREMTDNSQFIIITHSKRTMQGVDVLYGVTMQEPGVSKLVGVRIAEATARSEKRLERPADDGVAAVA
ncbi:MAG: chromosome segregation protein SMC [Polyangiaceae bacterium]|nr:chromosome segregation protein SMC [Polyangiaceae bacterium]